MNMFTKGKVMVSVIIPIRHDDPYIFRCVESVKNSTYKDIEVIIVDEGLERSVQRNIGVERSKGEYILILDSDMTIHERLINDCVEECTEIEYVYTAKDALFITEEVVGEGWWIKVRNFERQFYDGTFIDCPRFFKRSKWIPFDITLTGVEDWDWSRRFEGSTGEASYPIYHYEGKFNFATYIKKKRYYSQWMDRYKLKYPGCQELDVWYRFFGVFIERKKWKKIVRHPILFIGVIFLRLSVGIAYLCAKKF